ncbi:MAG: hypothetical protein HZB61_01940 [Nitrospirae bacterium]|nr:hypothetical protein [Nitrospirota bacterium]
MKTQLVLNHIKTKSLPFFIGALAGYAVVHPYTMLVYSLTGFAHSGMHLKDIFFSFDREMLPMGVAFTVLGGFIGILIAVVIEKQRQLYTVIFENEKKKITLSHYLLNANMVIGGMVRRCQRIQTNEDSQCSLEAIAEQAKKIDAVISALKRLTEIKTAKYTAEGHALMIDISKEIEELLAGDSAKRDDGKSSARLSH